MSALPGFHGKLPAAGDFVQRRLPQDFLQPWDAHFSACMAGLPDILAEDWRALYLRSHLHGFALGRGLCGDYAWAGVVAPGRDRVGRCFPLTAAVPCMQALPSSVWFFAVAQVLVEAMSMPASTANALDAALMVIPADVDGAALPEPGMSHWWVPGSAPRPCRGLPSPEAFASNVRRTAVQWEVGA